MTYEAVMWTEWIQSALQPVATFVNESRGRGAMYQHNNYYYLAIWPSPDFIMDFVSYLCEVQNVNTTVLDPNMRIQSRGGRK